MAKKVTPMIGILLGSDSDFPIFQKAMQFLEENRIPVEVEVTSAHRTPERTVELVKSFEKKGIRVIIAAAGGAAHLPGVVAAHTLLPVLGVPVSSPMLGLDSLLSMCQMPGGIPVATFGIGESGAYNATLFALQLLASSDDRLMAILQKHRVNQTNQVLAKGQKLKKRLPSK